MTRLDDDEVLAAFRDAAQLPPPSPFTTARAHRDLEAALDAEARSGVRWTAPRLAAIALAGAVAGALAVACAVAFAVRAPPAAPAVVARAPMPPPAVPVDASIAAAPAPPEPAASAPVAPPAAPMAVSGLVKPAPVRQAKRARTWRDEEQARLEAGDGVGAARIVVRALAHDDSAAAALSLLARRFPDALEAVDADLAAQKSAEAMRIRCEQKLLHIRDESAVAACRAFAVEHPEHPGARTLAFAAGRLAEDDLDDLPAAEDAYSRALLLSPFAGLPGTDALLARARVREELGNVDEARADLRLYLANVPGARSNPAVAALAGKLGI